MVNEQTRATLDRLNKSTNDLAARVLAALAKVNTGMSDEDVAAVGVELNGVADQLDGIAKDPENPVPGPDFEGRRL